MSQTIAGSRAALAAWAATVAIIGFAAASGSLARPVVQPTASGASRSVPTHEGLPFAGPTTVERFVLNAASGRDTAAADGQCTTSRRIIVDDVGNHYIERMRLCD